MTNFSKFISRALASFMVLLAFSSVILSTSTAYAALPTGSTPDFSDKGCVGGQALCNIGKGGDTRASLVKIITDVATFAIYILGAISVLFIIYGGFLYVTDDGSGTKAGQGKKIVIQALIGLVIAIASFTLVQITLSLVGNLNLGTSGSGSTQSSGIQN